MWSYQAPLNEMRFAMEHWLRAQEDWAVIPEFRDLDIDTLQQVLIEAERFAVEQLLPINASGDLEGCHFDHGRVTTPAGYRQAWHNFVDGGWPALACAPVWQGQGLPQLVNAAANEMFFACCHAWSMYPGLAHGAYECLRQYGSAELQQQYLPKLVSGEWLATMCLTEAHAGSDVGLLRTRAEADGSGAYLLTGNKIFISGGEQDLTDNIIHLVLARLPDAPAGSRGISLFLVPKLIEGQANGVRCTGIEKKMGIKGSATCSLSFEQARGWLMGEPNKGLAAMFVMMNAARLHVALQGLAHGEIAHQNALAYARERRQMRAVVRSDHQAADLIIEHPAVRRYLLEQRAIVQAERMLGYWAAHLLDVSEHHPDAGRRQQAQQRLSLLTPVLKSLLTETGFSIASTALQIFGGHGYIHDNGIEQCVRDCRITLLYEGTTEIQSVDLVARKIAGDRGAALQALLGELESECATCAAMIRYQTVGHALNSAITTVKQATERLLQSADQDAEGPLRGALDYQWLLGVVLMAYALIKAARVAEQTTEAASRLETARVFCDFVLPQAGYRQQLMAAACDWLPRLTSEL